MLLFGQLLVQVNKKHILVITFLDNKIFYIECARYTFWTPPHLEESKQTTTSVITQFPRLTHFAISSQRYSGSGKRTNDERDYDLSSMMTISGENFTRDLQIWFGDIKAPFTEYKNHEMLVCRLPSHEELMQSVGLNRIHDAEIQDDDEARKQKLPFSIIILLVRGDGVVYKTSKFYYFR
jgi:hypothetical protein